MRHSYKLKFEIWRTGRIWLYLLSRQNHSFWFDWPRLPHWRCQSHAPAYSRILNSDWLVQEQARSAGWLHLHELIVVLSVWKRQCLWHAIDASIQVPESLSYFHRWVHQQCLATWVQDIWAKDSVCMWLRAAFPHYGSTIRNCYSCWI